MGSFQKLLILISYKRCEKKAKLNLDGDQADRAASRNEGDWNGSTRVLINREPMFAD